MISLLDAALAYAAAHLPVFPLIPGGKVPAISRGFYAATTNPETIRRFWRIGDRNIGIPTGPASGVWAVDIDPGGDEHIRRLEAEHGELPLTRTVITPRRGKHLWFAYTGPIPSTTSRIAPHIDVRADGGYVAVVPSITGDGTYSWCGDPEAPLATAPRWLVDLARKKPTISERTAIKKEGSGRCFFSGAYGQAALDRECSALSSAPAGQRNAALNLASFRLHQLVAGGELDERDVEDQLIEACEKNGLVADDGLHSVERTIASGRAAGLQHPRSRNGGAA
jgi:hypothetical protein